jgi:23S rRNA (cytidine1920-2'-O)/16S rRNA (cytidine1409-2'-O)-methyltransferase
MVTVDGAPAARPARQVDASQALAVAGPPRLFVSRGGEKLAGALDELGIAVRDRRALDAGASTGGFTDCLLQRGAAQVYAVDVGRGQLAWSLRTDPRVRVFERTNVRGLEPAAFGGPVDLAVVDLSFISLLSVAAALLRCTTPDGDLLLLVKPQFEAGRARVGKGGVVRDPLVHAAVLREVTEGLGSRGLVVVGVVASPLLGADGNREFFAHCRHSGARVGPGRLDDLATGARR